MYLEKINGPADVKALSSPERTVLAEEMRTALIQKLSRHGGHCGPNLGLVEATIALHTVFDSPKDRFVFDVSHQTYPHKMLTGRSYGFLDPARYDDITGYSAPQESAMMALPSEKSMNLLICFLKHSQLCSICYILR